MTQPSMTQVSAEESVSAVSVNGLLARRLAERSVDALLPAGSTLLEEVEHVAINAQRYHLLDAGHCRRFRRQLGRGLGRYRLERLLGCGAGIYRSSGHGTFVAEIAAKGIESVMNATMGKS